MKFVVSTEIDLPVADVWRWYAVNHVANHARWDPDMELTQISEGPIGLGTHIRRRNHHFDEPVDGEMEIAEWKPEEVMATHIRDANTDTYGRVTFEAIAPNRSRLTIEADYPGMDEATADRIRPLIERSLNNIRRLVESDPLASDT